ncbi:MAG: YbaK/EbsC family protein [Dehalococcoidia bacterium]
MNAEEQRVQDALDGLGLDTRVRVFDKPTHTSQEAADAAGCELGQIAKTLAFDVDGALVLVIIGGASRVDTSKLARCLSVPHKRVRMMPAETVVEKTGFAVGGVPAIGHDPQPRTLIDQGLLVYEEIWSAAGSSNAIFPIASSDLVRVTGAKAGDFSRSRDDGAGS